MDLAGDAGVGDASLSDEALLLAIQDAPIFTAGGLIRHACLTAPAGNACEFGVYKGQSLTQIRNYRKPPVYGFDSWDGLPEVWDMGDVHHEVGHFAVEKPTDFAKGVQLVEGLFSDTVPQWEGDIALLHIDCDLYSSAREVLFGLNDSIKAGTVILFDEICSFDGSYPNWTEGEWKAMREWQAEFNREVEPIGRTERHQVAFKVKG
jgi:hypothetical protein